MPALTATGPRTHTNTHRCTHIHTHTHTDAHTQTHTHTQTHALIPFFMTTHLPPHMCPPPHTSWPRICLLTCVLLLTHHDHASAASHVSSSSHIMTTHLRGHLRDPLTASTEFVCVCVCVCVCIQFFITTASAGHLDGKHVVFASVVQGKLN
jgi:hypothetical protein